MMETTRPIAPTVPASSSSRNNNDPTMRSATMLVTDAELALALTSSSSSSTTRRTSSTPFTSTSAADSTAAALPSSPSSSPDDNDNRNNNNKEEEAVSSSSFLSGISGSFGGNGGRFGTVYVGCRRVRPSSRLVRDALRERKKKMKKIEQVDEKTCEHDAPGEEDVVENDEEEEDERTKCTKRPRRTTAGSSVDEGEEQGGGGAGELPQEVANGNDAMHQDEEGCKNDNDGDGDDEYYRFPTAGGDPSALLSLAASSSRLVKEEVADLAGEREGVPPVALPYSMMRLAVPLSSCRAVSHGGGHHHGSSSGSLVLVPPTILAAFDVELSKRWAQRLKDSMRAAEELRDSEPNVRKMPYVLEPEVWSRKRPSKMLTTTTTTATAAADDDDGNGREEKMVTTATSSFSPSPGLWFPCQYDTADRSGDDEQRQSQEHQHKLRAETEAAIVQCLHNRTHLHVSCGAKFGCDYLLYEGSRHHYHAFAGVRVIVPPQHQKMKVPSKNDAGKYDNVTCEDHKLPIPTPYDMAGYVRGLNTAGKLALLATVVKDDRINDGGGANADGPPRYRVAMVDLALKKVRATTFKGASGTVTPKMLPKRPVMPVGAGDNQS